jgi:hypothetical protein
MQGEDVIYGQVVQLRHVSGDFITVQKTMAKYESSCLRTSMDEYGDEGSWFRVEPAFKFRNLGQRVPHGDRYAPGWLDCTVTPIGRTYASDLSNVVHAQHEVVWWIGV